MEQKKFIDILVWIAQLGDKVQNLPEKAQKIHQRAAEKYRKIGSRELEAILTRGEPKTVSLLNCRGFVYLPPIDKGGWLVPILSVEYNYSADNPQVSLKVALFLLVEVAGKENLRAIGYRFETPHGGDRHNYYHVQPIDGFGHSDRWKLPGTDWVPTDYPAFPIDAQDPIQLLISMLVSLYDHAFVQDIQGQFKTDVKRHVEKMKLFLPGAKI